MSGKFQRFSDRLLTLVAPKVEARAACQMLSWCEKKPGEPWYYCTRFTSCQVACRRPSFCG